MTTPTFSRQAFEDVASFLPIFEASGFDFGTWVVRQGSFPFVTYHPEVGRFVRTLERHGWVYESPDFLWGPWLRTPEAAKLLSGETLPAATPEQLARLLTVFARQERIVDGSRLEMYQSGLLLAALRRVQSWLEWLPPGDPDPTASYPADSAVPLPPSVRQDWATPMGLQAGPSPRQSRPFGEPARSRPAAPFQPPHPSSSLTFSEAAQGVHAFISQFEEGYFPPLLMLARLTEETGEIARVLAHQNGKTPKLGEDVGDLEMELADLLFVTLCLANEQGLSLERGFARMMDKIERRDRDRWTRKVDLSWDVAEPMGADPVSADFVSADPVSADGETTNTAPIPAGAPEVIGNAPLEQQAEAFPLELPPGDTLVISARAGELQVTEQGSQEGEDGLMLSPDDGLTVAHAPAQPVPAEQALTAQPTLTADADPAAELSARTRRGKAGGEIAKPVKALARKRNPRK